MAEYVTTNRVRAPWTEAQVEQLQRWQASTVAPTWCCENEDVVHRDDRRLHPDSWGWACLQPGCDAHQPGWAWLYMFDPVALESVEAVGVDADEDTKWADYTARKRAHEGPKPAPVCPHCGGTLG